MDAKRYMYRVQWSDEDGEFIGKRADFLAVLDAMPDAPPDPGDELPSR